MVEHVYSYLGTQTRAQASNLFHNIIKASVKGDPTPKIKDADKAKNAFKNGHGGAEEKKPGEEERKRRKIIVLGKFLKA